MPTLEMVGHVYEEAKKLMEEREQDYNDSWLQEGLTSMVGSQFKKASQIKTMFENGRWKGNITRFKEDILDQINYCVFMYKLVEMDESKTY